MKYLSLLNIQNFKFRTRFKDEPQITCVLNRICFCNKELVLGSLKFDGTIFLKNPNKSKNLILQFNSNTILELVFFMYECSNYFLRFHHDFFCAYVGSKKHEFTKVFRLYIFGDGLIDLIHAIHFS